MAHSPSVSKRRPNEASVGVGGGRWVGGTSTDSPNGLTSLCRWPPPAQRPHCVAPPQTATTGRGIMRRIAVAVFLVTPGPDMAFLIPTDINLGHCAASMAALGVMFSGGGLS